MVKQSAWVDIAYSHIYLYLHFPNRGAVYGTIETYNPDTHTTDTSSNTSSVVQKQYFKDNTVLDFAALKLHNTTLTSRESVAPAVAPQYCLQLIAVNIRQSAKTVENACFVQVVVAQCVVDNAKVQSLQTENITVVSELFLSHCS